MYMTNFPMTDDIAITKEQKSVLLKQVSIVPALFVL
jgi:hypothetical protein